MPKAQLKANSLNLHSEYIIAAKLRKTHRQLLQEMAPGELAYWLAHFELEHEEYERTRKEAEREAERKTTRGR